MTKNEIREAAKSARLAAKIARIMAQANADTAAVAADLATRTAPGVNLRPEYVWTIGGVQVA